MSQPIVDQWVEAIGWNTQHKITGILISSMSFSTEYFSSVKIIFAHPELIYWQIVCQPYMCCPWNICQGININMKYKLVNVFVSFHQFISWQLMDFSSVDSQLFTARVHTLCTYQILFSRFKRTLLLPIRHSIQYSHISINYKYQYKYNNILSWEQRELEILWDLWAPCLFHI